METLGFRHNSPLDSKTYCFLEVRGVSEKVLHRLEQLDLDTGSRQFFGGLTQEEYTMKVEASYLTFMYFYSIHLHSNY